jgi:hypothetical protein
MAFLDHLRCGQQQRYDVMLRVDADLLILEAEQLCSCAQLCYHFFSLHGLPF